MPTGQYPPVPGVARCDLLYLLTSPYNNVSVMNSFYWYDASVTRDATYLSALAEDVNAAFVAAGSLEDQWTQYVTLETIRVTDLETVPHLTLDRAAGHVGDGGAGATTPATVVAVVRLPVLNPGEPQGTYIRHGPIQEAAIDGNTVGATARGEIATAYTLFFNTLKASQAPGIPVAVSVYNPGGSGATRYRDTGLINPIVEDSISVRPLIGRRASAQT